jgi:hypothetical protein
MAGATWSGCSGAATASVETVHVRNGPVGTSAENNLNLTDDRRAITLSFTGSCWMADRILSPGRAEARDPKRKFFTRRAKSLA